MSSTKKIALPITACCLVLVAIGVVVGYYLQNNPNKDTESDGDTAQIAHKDTHSSRSHSIHCTVCGDEKHRSTFYENVFKKYLDRTSKTEEEIEYGHRCEHSNEHPNIDCGKDGICWRISYVPETSSNFSPLKNLISFVDTGDWKTYGNSKGCLVNAHSHKFAGEELLSHAIDNAKDQRLMDVMFQDETRIIQIHFCKSENCNAN